MSKTKVLIVDDSALMRQMLNSILSADPEVEVVGYAPDPIVARRKIRELNPDVITLDVEMPKMDGITFLEKIMSLRPMPVVMISTLTQKGASLTLQALELGAVDFIPKPSGDQRDGMLDKAAEIVEKVKHAARANVKRLDKIPTRKVQLGSSGYFSSGKIVAIGASTGGVEAIQAVLTALPATMPPILITQHMPESFTGAFADRLDKKMELKVFEATDGQRILPGQVYIAPGGRHLQLDRSGAHFVCRISDGDKVSGHKPSVDVLFESVARLGGKSVVAAILTGMGRDGARGLLEIREAGGITLGQDEESSVVYGMPKAAFETGAVMKQHSLSHMAQEIARACQEDAKRAVGA